MRIIYLHQYFNTPKNSGGTRSYEMARRLVADGHEVHMITSDRLPENGGQNDWYKTMEAGIHVHWLPVPYSNHMSFSQRLRAFFRFALKAAGKAVSIKGDVVFATSTPLTIALPAVYASRRQRIPMVFEVRDLWPELPIAIGALHGKPLIWAARRLERFAYRNSAQIVALSPGMKDGVVVTGYPDSQVHVIPNSADLEMFDVPIEQGLQFRNQFDWLQNRPLVIYAGTLGRINGVEYLAKLAAAVLPKNPDICFLVMGDGAEKKKVEAIARQLGVFNKNFFMLDPIAKSQMPSALEAADMATSLFVDLPEMRANSANKFFDALASGTPVAINYRGWQAVLLEESKAGIVLDATDTEAAAITLIEMLQDKAWLTQAGKATRQLAVDRFSRDMLAKQLEDILLTAVAEHKGS